MSAENASLPQATYRAALLALFFWFGARLTFFAVLLDPGVPPDEVTHLGRVLAFSQVWGWPEEAASNHELGLLTHRPFLYNWLLGKLLAFNVFPIGDLLFLRLVNALLGLTTAFYGLRFIRVVTQDRLTHVLFVLLLTNTLMFTGICAAVSYDNGANLLAVAAVFHAFRLGRDGDPKDLVMFVVFAAAGCLTKRSFIPLAGLLVIGLLFRERHRLAALARGLDVRAPEFALALVLVLANTALYGGNLVRFRHLVPGFEQVVGLEAARTNRIFARDWLLDGFREGRLSYAEAVRLADGISSPRDRQGTRMLLAQIRKRGDWRLPRTTYARMWSEIMLDRTVGYFGHQVIRRTPTERAAYAGALALAIALYGVGWRRAASTQLAWGGGLALAYALVLLVFVNYPTYVEMGLLDAGVQGRYLFPVLVPLLGFVAYAYAAAAPRPLRLPLSLALAALFLFGDLPTFLLRATPAWFASPS